LGAEGEAYYVTLIRWPKVQRGIGLLAVHDLTGPLEVAVQ
jgi:hypothetical protein